MNNAIIEKFLQDAEAGQGIDICGDGRSDSPGYSAKYTSYSFREDQSKKIIHMELVQVGYIYIFLGHYRHCIHCWDITFI